MPVQAAPRIVIVGAGHAGLCVVEALTRRGLDASVVDGADRLGDVWRNRYEGLRLNTERDASQIPGTTLPTEVGRWPTRTEWADHIESAATQLDVHRTVATVDAIVAGRHGGWVIRTDHADHAEIGADIVVVATGRNRVPVVPDWPGLEDRRFELLHAADYHEPAPFVGRRVLVVGAGNSGTEIAHLLDAAGADVTLSMRRRPVWARRELFGSNLTEFARMGKRLPDRVVDLSGRLMQPLLFGRMKPFGLGPPDRRLSNVAEASGATLDSGFVDDVKQGRISLVAAVDWVDGSHVVLADGQRIETDVLIAGTGFSPRLEEFLPPDTVEDGWPINPDPPFEQAPGLFTAGLNPATLTAFHPDFIAEADRIAAAIAERNTPAG